MAEYNKRHLGEIAENYVCNYLESSGYIILKKNFRYRRNGEIDIIAIEGDYLCFIEVKARSTEKFGSPGESVNFRKIQKIKTIAGIYTSINNIINNRMRFDVVEVFFKYKNNFPEVTSINLIKNAFI